MANIKHIGRIKSNQRRVVVAYRTLPGDPYSALVVSTDTLDAADHDVLINLVESNTGQTAYELAEAMARTPLADGRIMLAAFHKLGKLQKVATNLIEMTPNTTTAISLDELNETIAQQRGISVDDLALGPKVERKKEEITPAQSAQEYASSLEVVEDVIPPATGEQPLDDEMLAAQYRSEADRLFKEAKRFREMAEDILPTKKKAVEK